MTTFFSDLGRRSAPPVLQGDLFSLQPLAVPLAPLAHWQASRARTLCDLARHLAGLILDVPAADISLPGRGPNRRAKARQCAMYLAHVGLGVSQHATARAFARDRATLRHACARVEDARDEAAFDLAMEQWIAAAQLWADMFLNTNLRGDA